MTKQKKSITPPLSIIYRKIAISFVVLTVLLVGIIVFFSIAKATIRITPKDEVRSAEFLVTVKKGAVGPQDPSMIQGSFEEKVVEIEDQFEATGVTEKQGRAEGKVTLINTSSVSQPLVATTRLLSPEGVLFRMRSAATVPAQGEVEVEVYADAPGPAGDIDPTKFTIPGLHAAKQKVIFGESKAAMTGGASNVRVVSADDLERAKTAAIEKVTTRSREEFEKSPAASLAGVIVSGEVASVEYDANKGDERQTFTVRGKITVQLLAYDKTALEQLAFDKVATNIPPDRELVAFNKDTMILRIKNVNATTDEVQLQVYADAQVRLSAASPLLDSVKIAGMLPEEATQYLQSFDAVEAVEVNLFPSWQKRIPTIPDRIKMVVRK